MKKTIFFVVSLLCIGVFACAKGTSEQKIQNNTEKQAMNFIIGGKTYKAVINNNKTSQDIMNNLPLSLNYVRYAKHEYYTELPFKPVFDKERTSHILAGHLYYWDGWNAFVINYKECDISPYKVVHIGEIEDKSIVKFLEIADKNITIEVKNR